VGQKYLVEKEGFADALRINFKELQDRVSLNVAEFVTFMLDQTSGAPPTRILNLEAMIDALDKQLWKEHFYLDKERLVPGKPFVRGLGEWDSTTSDGNYRMSLRILRTSFQMKRGSTFVSSWKGAIGKNRMKTDIGCGFSRNLWNSAKSFLMFANRTFGNSKQRVQLDVGTV
jgi:hypothetical protein